MLVKLNDGSAYSGAFICMDGNLNVVLENVQLWDSVEQAKNPAPTSQVEVFSDVFIRGNNVCYIAPFAKTDNEDSDSSSNGGRDGESSSSGDDQSSSSEATGRVMIQTVSSKGV